LLAGLLPDKQNRSSLFQSKQAEKRETGGGDVKSPRKEKKGGGGVFNCATGYDGYHQKGRTQTYNATPWGGGKMGDSISGTAEIQRGGKRKGAGIEITGRNIYQPI